MRILIIEDEPLAAKDIQNQILRVCPEAEILAILTSVEGAKKWFPSNPAPDLIFSDIQLSDGISFEIFEQMQINRPIIFTTAYDDYAIRAFKLNSIDYLLKPIDRAELERALLKYKALSTNIHLEERLRQLINRWGTQSPPYKERFLVMHGKSLVPLQQNEIAFFHKEQLIFVHSIKDEKFVCEFNALDEIEEIIDPALFFRVNRQFIIHIQAVAKIKSTHKGLAVILKNAERTELDISREKAAVFKKWMG